MKSIFAGVFIGVFVGALGYEILSRTNPEMVESIRRKVSNEVDAAMGKDDDADDFDDFDDMEFEPKPSKA